MINCELKNNPMTELFNKNIDKAHRAGILVATKINMQV
jgi:hypothetical protein